MGIAAGVGAHRLVSRSLRWLRERTRRRKAPPGGRSFRLPLRTSAGGSRSGRRDGVCPRL